MKETEQKLYNVCYPVVYEGGNEEGDEHIVTVNEGINANLFEFPNFPHYSSATEFRESTRNSSENSVERTDPSRTDASASSEGIEAETREEKASDHSQDSTAATTKKTSKKWWKRASRIFRK